jgi:hypothetical protein
MKKKSVWVLVLSLILITMIVGVVAAETYQCSDPSNGTVNVRFTGSTVVASYGGKNSQSFEVIVVLENDTVKVLNFNFPYVSSAQSRVQTQDAGRMQEVKLSLSQTAA